MKNSYRAFVRAACERCSPGAPLAAAGADVSHLHVHHVDRDRSNNEPSNLETLCAWHHANEHNEQRKETKRNMVYLRLSGSMRERWDAAAAERGVGLSEMIRLAVEDLLDSGPLPELVRPAVMIPASHPQAGVRIREFKPDFKK